jgi:hypothetical protein
MGVVVATGRRECSGVRERALVGEIESLLMSSRGGE